MAETANRVSRLSETQQALLEKRRRGEFVPKNEVSKIVSRARNGRLPLSFAQQRLWILDQLEPGNTFYNISKVMRLKGELKLEALDRTVSEIVRRHEVLRTRFLSESGEPWQEVTELGEVKLAVTDLSGFDEAGREAAIAELVKAEGEVLFDLAHGPLLRAKVLRLSAQDHVVALTMHHIVSDGWSMGVLIKEVTSLYDAYSRGAESLLPELPIQYADFAVWQREWLQGEELERQLSYWRKQLNELPVLELPSDRPRPAVLNYRGAQLDVSLPPELVADLKDLSSRAGVTLFMTLLAAFQTLLQRYSGQREIVVGTAIANRNHAETEGLIGFFVNTLVLRADMRGEPSFLELLRQVKEVCLGAYAHQDVPFEKLVEELQPERDLSRSPLFQTMFILQNLGQQQWAAGMNGLQVSGLRGETKTAKLDLLVSANERPQGLELNVDYSTDLFDEPRIARMMRHFEVLLQGIVAQPEQRLWELPLLEADEWQQTVRGWNETRWEFAAGANNLAELFEAQAALRPEAIAVVYEGEQLSYGELNARSNQLAHYLRRRGVSAETLVGVCLERSLEMVTALLGILKAGGAYLPLDPEYPQARLALMVQEAGARLVLTQGELAAGLGGAGVSCVRLEQEWTAVARESRENPESQTSSENLAYVSYTSGSTGRPKGVTVPHRGVLRLVCNTNYIQLERQDVVLQMAPLSFDASTFELWGALLNGARLVVMRAGPVTLAELAEVLVEQQVTTLWLTAGLFHVMVSEQLGALAGVSKLLAGGDVLLRSGVEQVLGAGSGVLINGYGPTENTTFSCCHVMERGVGATVAGVTVPIGRPVANTRVYVVDEALQVAPVGVNGELLLGGDGLARGYLQQAELTAASFIPDPFSGEAGARLYRTGDVARYRANGELEFVGRRDEQVKVRGYRIELGEVELALASHPAVRESVVVSRAGSEGGKRLIGYVVWREAVSAGELREYLGERLPEYMIPSQIVELEELPLNANGKVDRRKLPLPEEVGVGQGSEYVGPRTPAEEILANIWAKLLGLKRVSIHDNFFELGGDSIIGIQAIARANQAGLRLSPKDLFQHQTVAKLAPVAGSAKLIHAEQGVVLGRAELIPIQHWFFEQEIIDPHHFNQSLLLQVRSQIDPSILREAAGRLLTHHDALRLRYQSTPEGWQQFYAPADEQIGFRVIDLCAVAQQGQAAAIESAAEETQASLSLSDGPMLRLVYFDLGAEQPARLLIVCQHLVIDGVSWRILLEDLQTAYEQLAAGERVQLPAKTTSFQHWAATLKDYCSSKALISQSAYWLAISRQAFAGLPRDHAGENSIGSLQTVNVALSAEETRALLREVPAVYHTQINEVLLAALALTLTKWTGSSRVLIDMEGHGREQISEQVDVSRTVGWFTTIYPVPLEINGHRALEQMGEVLKSVKEQLRQVPEQGIGYGLLRYLSEDAELRSTLKAMPQAQVIFNYVGQVGRALGENSAFNVATEFGGSQRSSRGKREHLLEISSLVAAGRLQLSWIYSDQAHNRETIEQVAQEYIKALRQIIRHCQSDEAGGYTPSDFPLARLTQAELDQVLVQPAVVEDLYRLSPMQQGMLFHCLYAPQSGLYFEQMQNRFEGDFDVEGLKSAWQQVLERHAILRSSYHSESLSSPVQLVHAVVWPEWLEEDWRELSSDLQEQKLERFLVADRERGFDFTQAPLMRFALLRLGDAAWQFVWSFHHMLLDGWCMSLLMKEVFSYYEAYRRGEQLELARPRPYRDYIQWLQAQDTTAAETYWRNRLAGFTSPTLLGIAAPASALPLSSSSYAVQEIYLSAQTTSELEGLARQQQVTLNTVVQGAWAILLSRYSGESDVVFGATVSGRPAQLAGVEQMVGLFINSLPVRVRMQGELRLGAWLQELQRGQAEMRQYEYSPLVEVQGWSEVERGVPLFESLLAYENYPVEQLAAGAGESAGRIRYEQVWGMERTNYPLTLVVGPGRTLLLKVLYEGQRLGMEAIARLLGHLEQLLESMAKRAGGAGQQLSELRLLTAAEEEQLLVAWNATGSEYPREQCLAEIFEQQAALRPEAIAVVHEREQLSYGELNGRSNQLAHYLSKQGVGPEVAVGVCLERSLEFVVAVLGILKAGGAYVPLDPDYPAERLRLMIEDAGLRVVLTQGQWLDRLPPGEECQLVDMGDGAVWAAEEQANPAVRVDSNQVAYIIFTSGSTGRPKGVLGLHRGMVNRFHWMWQAYPFTAGEVCCQKTSISFGDSIWETLGPLLQGIPTVIISNDEVKDIERFIEVLERHGVTRVVLVPSLLRVLLEAREVGARLSKLKYCVCSGEALPAELAQRFQERLPQCRLLNLYGSSEASADATYHEVGKGEVETRVSIGRPLSNIQVYILDQHMQPLPVGARGELYVGGDALARGYVQRAEVTAEQFVPHPYSANGGERLYRMGDEARYLEDGRIEFLGRRDHQVKVRGFRIELGEIEAVLKSHSGVRQAVVTMREQQQLAAYVVAAEGESRFVNERELAAELRGFLRERLPEYMLPQRWVLLAQMPLTASGKIDRQRLPAPVIERRLDADEEGEWTAAEEMVAGIWSEVLKLSAVARDENFFELGGHSLLATQVMSRVREMFGVELPLRGLFEEPTVRGLSQSIEEQLRAGAGVTAPALRRLTLEEREQRGGVLPLSFAQQRVWFLDQLQPESAFYNMGSAMRLKGELNIAALGQALSEIVRRHEVLRTKFVDVGGEPRQEVLAVEKVKLVVTDLSSLPETEREAEVRREIISESQAPFDLAHGPLLRVKLMQLGDEDHVIVLMMHHIVSDGWSMGVLIKEVTKLYEAYSQGEVSPLAELPVQYADFAVWQRKWLQGEELERQLGYWRKQLGELPVLELPTDRARPAVQSYRGAQLSVRLSAELSARLRELSRREGVTLFMTLLAAFQTLLLRYSGQQQIVVGTAIANRNLAQTEGLIGFFANTLVLPADMSGEPTFVALLQRVKEVCLGAYAHQDVPFEKLVEELQPERDLSRSPLFQTMFILNNLGRQTLTGIKSGLQVSRLHGETQTAKLDLILAANEGLAGLELNAEYSTDLFDEPRIARMMRHFEVLLQGIVAQPEQRLWELPLLEAAEWQQTVRGWNETRQEFEAGASNLPELFEAQAARRPEAVAVGCGAAELSYGELNRRSNQLAHYLKKLGVDSEQLVGLCVERSVELVVGMLGILKAGAAYLPLDPSYPPERLAFQFADSRSEVLLTTERLAELVPGSAKVVRMDAEWELIEVESEEGLPRETNAAELAYVIYTSGSTGRPKGVMVSHGSVLNLFAGINGRLGVGAEEVWTNCHSAAFDFSVWELWGPLLSGGRLVIVPAATMQAPVEQRELFASQGVTLLSLTPSGLLQVLSDGGQWLSESGVKQLVVGGEACTAELAQAVCAHGLPSWNFYGPTEATVWSSIGELRQGDPVTLGRPISNTELYVLDEWLQAAPVGARGEIYIGGAGLARGYWQRAELTAERFVPHPYSVDGGERLYRTGDEGRYLEDGRIEYLGRRDQQVKVRGYRIELGEIEAVLESHPGVRQAVVTVREEQQLVGYVVGDWPGNEREVAAELRPYLRERLPEYMVPQRWVVLEQMPLTANGKIDRRGLPTHAEAGSASWQDEGEWTPVEELVAKIWSEVLKRESMGRNENFFELGGHSLLATQVISRVRQVLGVELPVRRLFEEPTVRGLSHGIEEQLRAGAGVTAPPLQRLRAEEREQWGGLLPLSFAQQRLWFLGQLEPGASYNNTKAVPLKGELKVAALERTFSEVVRRHEALRTRFVTFGDEPRQEVLQPQGIKLTIMDLSDLDESEREVAAREVVKAQTLEPFDLTQAPLLRVKLLRLADDEHVVVLTMHHIVSDGWSMGVLLKEVTTLYEAYSLGSESPLPELPVQYSDFAVWQRSWLQGEELERQLVYWRKQLGGELPRLELPTDGARPAVLSNRGAQLNFQLAPEVSAALKELSRREGVTLFMTLLAAFQTLLHRYSGQEDIVVGSNLAGRNYAETENLIGFFANTLPLRVQLSGELSFVALLQQVKEVVLGAHAHQDVPFEKLVEELQPERELNRSPLLEVVFLLNNESDATRRLPAPGNEQAPNETMVRFDLTVSLTDHQTTLAGAWQYRTDLFQRATIEKLLDNFAALLQSITANPNGRLSTFEIFTTSEKESSLMKKQARDQRRIQRLKALKKTV